MSSMFDDEEEEQEDPFGYLTVEEIEQTNDEVELEDIEDILVRIKSSIEILDCNNNYDLENKMEELIYRMKEIEEKQDRIYHLILKKKER